MKSVEHWKQVKACTLRPFDVVMIPCDTIVPSTNPKTGRPMKRTIVRYRKAMVASNYLHNLSPYAKIQYVEDTGRIPTYIKLDKGRMVWKFVESRVSGIYKNELAKILSPNQRRALFNHHFGADNIAGIRNSVECNSETAAFVHDEYLVRAISINRPSKRYGRT